MSKYKGDYPRDCYPIRPPRAIAAPTGAVAAPPLDLGEIARQVVERADDETEGGDGAC